MAQAKQTNNGTPNMAAATQGTISLDPIFKGVFEEIKAGEQEVAVAQENLMTAREKLAAAKGKLEVLSQLQQMIVQPAQ